MILYFNNKLLHDQVCLIDLQGFNNKENRTLNALCAVYLNKRLKPSYIYIYIYMYVFNTVSSTQTGITVKVTNLRYHLKNIITLIAYI